MTARVVLFGGSGFIGRALRDGLSHEVVAPSRREVDLMDEDRLHAYIRPGDVIVNASGYAAASDRSAAGRARFRRDNVEAVRTLARASSAVGAERLVQISSVAAMGHRDGQDLSEHHLAPPRSPYGQSKRDGELALAGAAGELPVTILRPTSVFGEGRGLAAILCRIASLPVIPLPASGRALVPFTYVGNLVAAVDLLLDGPADTGAHTYIVGDLRSYALREVLGSVARALGRERSPMLPLPATFVHALGVIERSVSRPIGRTPLLDLVRIETLTSSVSYSTAAFREATGYVPPISLDSAMDRIARWHRSERAR